MALGRRLGGTGVYLVADEVVGLDCLGLHQLIQHLGVGVTDYLLPPLQTLQAIRHHLNRILQVILVNALLQALPHAIVLHLHLVLSLIYHTDTLAIDLRMETQTLQFLLLFGYSGRHFLDLSPLLVLHESIVKVIVLMGSAGL